MTQQQEMRKMEHDAWLAKYQNSVNSANIDYLAMMSDIEIPTEDGGADDESEV